MIGIAVRGDGPSDAFRQALEPVRTEHQANHNYSVWLSSDDRVFQRLQWGGCTVVRTRDPSRFGRALALHLSGHGAPSTGRLRTDGVVAVHDGRATVLPPSLRQEVSKYERPLREAGIILHDAPWVDFDPTTGEAVLDPPSLAASSFDDVMGRLPPARHAEPIAEFGRYPLAGWHFASIAGVQDQMSTIDAVTMVLGGLRCPLSDTGLPAAVATMFGRIAFDRLPMPTPGELVDLILA